MARTETTTRTLYTFEELSETAQDKAIEEHSNFLGQEWSGSDMFERTFVPVADILGIDFRQQAVKLHGGGTRNKPVIYYSGFWSQGDGACFEGDYAYKKGASKAIRAEFPEDTELHRIADELQKLQQPFLYGLTANMRHSGHYYHSGCMRVEVGHKWDYSDRALPEDDLTQLMRDFADWMYHSLEKEYEYQTGREQVIESIKINEYEFTEDGVLA